MAWLPRGMENLLVDFLANPQLTHAICEKLTELRVRQAVRHAELGVDILNPVQPECNDLAAGGRNGDANANATALNRPVIPATPALPSVVGHYDAILQTAP